MGHFAIVTWNAAGISLRRSHSGLSFNLVAMTCASLAMQLRLRASRSTTLRIRS